MTERQFGIKTSRQSRVNATGCAEKIDAATPERTNGVRLFKV